MKQNKLIPPMELKTIEVDVEKKIFKVNGKDFGQGTTGFSISCEAAEGYRITMEIETTVRIAEYRMSDGQKTTDRTYERNGQSLR